MIYIISSLIYILGLAVYKLLLLLAWLIYAITRLLTSVMETHRTTVREACKAEWDLLFTSDRRVFRSDGQEREEDELPRCTCSDPAYCHIWCISKHRFTKDENQRVS